MRKSNALSVFLSGLVLIGCLAFESCEMVTEGETGDKQKGHMTARIDGKSFISEEDQLGAVHDEDYLVISGATNNEQEIITFQMFDFPGKTGSYSLGTGEYEALCFYSAAYDSFYILDDIPGSTGTLVITELSETSIRGTFHFIGYSSQSESVIEVTEGSFKIPVHDAPR